MSILKTALLAGLGSIALAGPVAAAGGSPQPHVMTVQLPGGGIEEIRYSGNVAPEIVMLPEPAAFGAAMPWLPAFGPATPFADLDRISAEMDREAAALWRLSVARAAEPALAPGQPTAIDAASLPLGSRSYSVMTTFTGSGVCTRSVEVTSAGPGAKPQIVSHSSGSCGPVSSAGPAFAPPQTENPNLLSVKAEQAEPHAAPVREAAWQR